MEVMAENNTLNDLSMGKLLAGLAYMKIQGTKKQTTTVMREPPVWSAFYLPS